MYTKLPKGHGELILVVDDEEGILGITKAMLEANGYKVIIANDGTEAVALYDEYKHEIKAALVDILMPLLDGWLTIKKMKKIEPHIKIIVTSGLVEDRDNKKINNAGAKTFLMKPYTAETLLSTLDQVLHEEVEM